MLSFNSQSIDDLGNIIGPDGKPSPLEGMAGQSPLAARTCSFGVGSGFGGATTVTAFTLPQPLERGKDHPCLSARGLELPGTDGADENWARPNQSLLLKEEPVHPRRLQEVSDSRQVEQMRRIAFILLVGLVAQSAPAGAQESRWGAIALGGNGFGATRGRPDEASATSGPCATAKKAGALANAVSA